jgi:hypothetical protein
MIKIFNFFDYMTVKKYVNEDCNYNLTLGICREGFLRYKFLNNEFDKNNYYKNIKSYNTVNIAYHFNFQYIKNSNDYTINDNFFHCKNNIEYDNLNNYLDLKLGKSILYLKINQKYLNKDLICNCINLDQDEFYLDRIHKELINGQRSLINKLKDKFYFTLIWQYEKMIFILNNDKDNNLFYNFPGEISTENYKKDMKILEFGTQYYIDIQNKYMDKVPY